MTILLLDCSHGALKDAFANAIIGLLPDDVMKEMRERMSEVHDEAAGHHHHSIDEVHRMIASLGLSAAAERSARGVYALLAEAEAKAHGVPLEEVHFHEVGSKEAVTCVSAACAAVTELSPDRIVATPICTGFGFVDCAHGRLPIPAPATANLLEGLPSFEGEVEGEKTTPTGAALVRFFAQEFVDPKEVQPTWTAMVGAA